MKKNIKYLFSIVIALLLFGFISVLASCNGANTKNLKGTMSVNATGSTLEFTCKVEDPDSVATVGSVMIHYWEYDSDTEEKSNGSTLKFSNLPGVETDGSYKSETKIASSLKTEQEYYVKFYCTVGEDEFVFEERVVQTNSKGNNLDDPVLISTADQLYNMKEDLDGYYKLTSDIDLSTYTGTNKGESIFGSTLYKFSGHLDGNGHTISNYSQTTSNQYGSIFGYLDKDAVIENLNIDSPSLNFSRSSTGYAGGFVSYNAGTIRNINVTNVSINYSATSTSASVETCLGGFVGYNLGTIENATVTGSLAASYKMKINVGGFAGVNEGKISNSTTNLSVDVNSSSTSTSTEELTYNIGGFAGVNEGRIEESIAQGEIKTKYSYDSSNKVLNKTLAHNLGGFVGLYKIGVIDSCLTDVSISYESSQSFVANIGAFFGYVTLGVSASSATNNVAYATDNTFDIKVLSSDGVFNFEYEEYKEGSTTETEKKTSDRKINVNWLNSLDSTYVENYYKALSFALIGTYNLTCDEASVKTTIEAGTSYSSLILSDNVKNYISAKTGN